MDQSIAGIMEPRLVALLDLWRRGEHDFTGHRDHLLIVDAEAGHFRYSHYGQAFVRQFGADLTGELIDLLPADVLPAGRRGMLAFDYAFVLQAQKPLWRAYTARFDADGVQTWQRLVLPLGPDRLVAAAYPAGPAEGLLAFVIERVPVVLGADGGIEDLAVSLESFSSTQLQVAELEELASRDPLTGVSNRRHFDRLAALELDHARRMGRAFSLLVLDIDHFKRINDSHGHAAGDLALKAFANVCRDTLREPDILGRVGGEEFAVALPNTGIDGALVIAERLRAAVEALSVTLPDGTKVGFTVSIGLVSSGPGPAANAGELMQRADEALYVSKRGGRNRVSVG